MCVCVSVCVCGSAAFQLCALAMATELRNTRDKCDGRTKRNDKNLNRTLYKKRIRREKNRLIKDSTVKKKKKKVWG